MSLIEEGALAVYYRTLGQTIIVSGRTYPYKDKIKALGGRFQGDQKVWHIEHNEDNLAQIDTLCKGVGGGRLKEPTIKSVPPLLNTSPSTSETSLNDDPKPENQQDLSGLTVSELMQKINMTISQSFPRAVWMIGEVQNLNLRAKGCFFNLADLKENASKSATMTASCVIWSSTIRHIREKLKAESLENILQDGMKIRVLVTINFYKDRGQISLGVRDIDPRFTKGALALAREELMKELRQKGLDRLNPSLSLSPFPFKIGLISADGSRAKSDFLDQLHLYKFPGNVIFYASAMQGEHTLSEVCQGISELAAHQCDLIVVTRGGGSLADLRWFDSKQIAHAIAHCKIPVLAAIGHQDDVCVAEMVSFRREKTPTAAADFILSVFQQTKERLSRAALQLYQQLNLHLNKTIKAHTSIRDRLLFSASSRIDNQNRLLSSKLGQVQFGFNKILSQVERTLEAQRYALQTKGLRHISNQDQLIDNKHFSLQKIAQQNFYMHMMAMNKLPVKLLHAVQAKHREAEKTLSELENNVTRIDPSPWLQKGWTQLMSDQSRVTSVSQLTQGQHISARLLDGKLDLTVSNIELKREHHEQ